MEDINDRIATDILTKTEMRKAIGRLLDEWKEDAPPRKERRQMRRWAKKNGRNDVLMYLNALEGALRNNFGSKKGVLCTGRVGIARRRIARRGAARSQGKGKQTAF